MNPVIGSDAHRRYSLFAVFGASPLSFMQTRVNYQDQGIPHQFPRRNACGH